MLERAILHRNLECQVHESRQIGSGQTGDIEWFALETNTDHSVIFEIALKYNWVHGISDSFVDYEGYYISSKGFLPTVIDIMVI